MQHVVAVKQQSKLARKYRYIVKENGDAITSSGFVILEKVGQRIATKLNRPFKTIEMIVLSTYFQSL